MKPNTSVAGSAAHHNFKSLVDLLRHQATVRPEHTALIFLPDGELEVGRLTYGELDRRARAFAARLQADGLTGQPVLLMLPSSIYYVVAFVGCLYAGAIPVPGYPPTNSMHAERMAHIVADCNGQGAIVATSSMLGTIASRLGQFFPSGLSQQMIAVDGGIDSDGEEWLDPVLPGNATAYVQYTSGSTGNPRGVVITHDNLLSYCESWRISGKADEHDVFVTWLPLFHDMGLILGVLQALYVGASIVMMPPVAFLLKPLRWLTAISKYRGTISYAPNFAYELCAASLDQATIDTLDLSSWDVAGNAGEPIHSDTLEKFAQRFESRGYRAEAINPSYSLPEATLTVTSHPRLHAARVLDVDADALGEGRLEPVKNNRNVRTLVSCGRAWLNVEVLTVNPVTHQACAQDEIGEIWMRGPVVAKGYWQRPEETGQTFGAHLANGDGPFLRTGDLGAWSDDELYVIGRLKDVIAIRGKNHHPHDIEHTVYRAHPALAVGHGAAFSIKVDDEERLVVVQEVRRSQRYRINGAEIVEAIRSEIAKAHGVDVYEVQLLKPVSVHITSSGKIQRHACRNSFLRNEFYALYRWREGEEYSQSQPSTVGPVSYQDILDWLTERVADTQHVEATEVAGNTPFSDLGHDSLKLVKLTNELSNWLNKPVEPTLPYSYVTINSLAGYLVEQDKAKQQDTIEVKPSELEQDRDRLPGTYAASKSSDPIAIVGMACRVPGAPSVDAYWNLLVDGGSAIAEVPASRWAADQYYEEGATRPGKMCTRWGGFIEKADEFDAQFFGISPREAESMDPQQRLLLETAWHALEDAGIPPDTLAGSNTGVFIGISTDDYRQLQLTHHAGTDAYSGTGNALSIAANRISYCMDLRGPSMAIDTACSSSLVAVHQARASLRAGECDLAIVGGVNLILAPETTIIFSQAQMMAHDGRCKTFDAQADGYVRSEGCGIIVLKRQSDALRDNDRILGLIAGSAVNQDGKSNGLTAPNGLAQEAVARQALASAGVPASRVSYIEAHGSGTNLGDPIEVNALKAVYGAPSETNPALWIGSVKTNIGHLEAAAGIAGLIKVVLSLQHRKILSHCNFRQLNPQISLSGTRCAIPAALQEWPGEDQPRLAGISSFGFGGTNAHVILQEAPALPASQGADTRSSGTGDSFDLLLLSAKNAAALRQLARDYANFFTRTPASLEAICHTAAAHRMHQGFRFALPVCSKEEAASLLHMAGEGAVPPQICSGATPRPPQGKTGFIFTGQGAQYIGMGRIFYEQHAQFRQIIDRCDAVLKPLLGTSLLSILSGENDIDLNHTAYAQPALFAIEYGLASVWQSCGIEPDFLIGHSLGEYVAACMAGVFSLEDGLTLVAHRGRLMQEKTAPGAMAAVHASAEIIASLAESLEENGKSAGSVCIAVYNSPQDIVLSGDPDALGETVTALAYTGATVTRLRVSGAFHSPLMAGILDDFRRCAEAVTYHPPRIPLISNISGQIAGNEIASSEYWVQHVLQPVQFAKGLQSLAAAGCGIFVEVGPHPALSIFGQQLVPDGIWLHSLRRDRRDDEQFLHNLGQWYAAGGAIDWNRWHAGRTGAPTPPKAVELPLYPFQRERFWFHSGQRPAAPDIEHLASHPLLGHKLNVAGLSGHRFENTLSVRRPSFIYQHCIFDKPVLPAAAFVEWSLAALHEATTKPASGWELRNVELLHAMTLSEEAETLVQLAIEEHGDALHIDCFSQEDGWRKHAAMEAQWLPDRHSGGRALSFAVLMRTLPQKAVEVCYEVIERRGLHYGPAFRGMKALWHDNEQALSLIEHPETERNDDQAYWMHPAILDACLHSLFSFLDENDDGDALLPVAINRLSAQRRLPSRVWCHTVWHGADEGWGRYSADLCLFNEAGEQLAVIEGLQLVKVPRAALNPQEEVRLPDAYEKRWEPLAAGTPGKKLIGDQDGYWLIHCGDEASAENYLSQFAALGQQALAIVDSGCFKDLDSSIIRFDPYSEWDTECVFATLKREGIAVRGMLLFDGWRSHAQNTEHVIEATCNLARPSFFLLKGFLAAYPAMPAKIVICTQGACVVSDDESEHLSKAGLVQSVLSGMTKAVISENPHLKCVQVDFDPVENPPSIHTLLSGISRIDGAGHIALRAGQWYEAQLGNRTLRTLRTLDADPANVQLIRSDASYLITGGLGGIGRSIAEWLVQNGARSLILISRTASESHRQWISRLQDDGIQVTLLLADISQEAAWIPIRAQLRQCSPIRGIVHAAGVLDDGAMIQLDWTRFDKVMAPKVRGAWHLHCFSQELELDFFSLCSSITSLIGAPGQSNYIVANSFLDSLAHYRRQHGLPATSINWGPWAETGMATKLAERFAERGMPGISTRAALEAFAATLVTKPIQVGIASVDWNLYAASRAHEMPYTLLPWHPGTAKTAQAVTLVPHAMENFGSMSPEQIKTWALSYLLEHVCRILRLGAQSQAELQRTFPQLRLNELGLDSLMAIELRNKTLKDIGVDVPIHYFIGGASVSDVISRISTQLILKHLISSTTASTQDDADMEVITL